MQTQKLFKLLTLLNGVKSTRWQMVMKLVYAISTEYADIKNKQWNDEYKRNNPRYYPLDLAEIKTWSTFDDTCVDLRFSNCEITVDGQTNNQLVCEVKIFDGDSFGGYRTALRFEATIWLSPRFIHEIEQNITWKFNEYLEDAYETHLEEQKKRWIRKLKSKIINEK